MTAVDLGLELRRYNPGSQTLPTSEQFGPTIQGEGPLAGRLVQFVRFGLCNLSCSWCDTPYTWDTTRFDIKAECPPKTAQQIVDDALPGVIMVISGGEPLLHQGRPAWEYVLKGLAEKGCEIQLETNGTIFPNAVTRRYVDHASISPKLANAGDHRGRNAALTPLWSAFVNSDPAPGHARWPLQRNAALKFVVADADDVRQAVDYANDHNWPLSQTWVMPLGTSTEELQARWPEIARTAADLHINATHRIHVLAFGDVKGT
ncbi:7-carboxy-7-deazaguanine synthase QueE [Rhodococcoides fascians]|uniref:7-carboxy-7-deazaguanine synthase QueE n=1 Tax=Rhodococcoides fascians TaxID=1828 RepID=UPI00068CBD2A|nr:radical SAM protein [Rhodococcus fascians]